MKIYFKKIGTTIMDLKKIDIGWIKMHRKIRKWKFYNKLKYEKIWTMFLMEANYDDQAFEGITIKRGELVFSYNSYLEKLKTCEPSITKQNLRTLLKNLEKDKQIFIYRPKDKNFSVIKILNYDIYQRDDTQNHKTKLELLEEENKRLRAIIDEINKKMTHTENNTQTHSEPTHGIAEINTPKEENQHSNIWQIADKYKTLKSDSGKLTHLLSKTNTPIDKINTLTQGESTQEPTLLKEVQENLKETKKIKKEYIKSSKENSKKEINEQNEKIFELIIDHLNKKTGKNLRKVPGHKKFILPKLKQGYSSDDFIKVIDNKVNEWINTPFEKYLRPKTLFNDDNFDSYVNESCSSKILSESEQKFLEYQQMLQNEENEKINKQKIDEKKQQKNQNKLIEDHLEELKSKKNRMSGNVIEI